MVLPRERAAIGSEGETRQRSSPAEKRQWILDSAARLFAERGYAKTTVSEIAAAARVAKGLVYVHFPSKQAMLEALMKREIGNWIRAAVDGAVEEGGNATEMIACAFRISVEYPLERPFLSAILAQEPRLLLHREEAETRDEPQRLVAYREFMEPLLMHGIRTGELRPDMDVAQVAQVLWLIQDGLLRAIYVARDTVRDSDRLIEGAIDFMKAGLESSRYVGQPSDASESVSPNAAPAESLPET